VSQRFSLGAVTFTAGVEAAVPDQLPLGVLALFIGRHVTGDFGELDEHDVAVNEHAIASCLRVLSAYSYGEVRVFVITEADRSRTTVLLRSEY
jgi:hypothetical protein